MALPPLVEAALYSYGLYPSPNVWTRASVPFIGLALTAFLGTRLNFLKMAIFARMRAPLFYKTLTSMTFLYGRLGPFYGTKTMSFFSVTYLFLQAG